MDRSVTEADLPIDTDRLRLRRFRPDDAGSVLALYGDPEVVRFLYSEPMQPDGLESSLARRLVDPRLASEGDVLELAAELRMTGEFVGAFTFFHRSDEHRRGEIGYTIAPRFSGQRFAQEGARALLQIGFELLGLHRIEGQCDARNAASAAVMTRIGMRHEAHLKEFEFVKGEWTDELVFAMLESEWRERTGSTGR